MSGSAIICKTRSLSLRKQKQGILGCGLSGGLLLVRQPDKVSGDNAVGIAKLYSFLSVKGLCALNGCARVL